MRRIEKRPTKLHAPHERKTKEKEEAVVRPPHRTGPKILEGQPIERQHCEDPSAIKQHIVQVARIPNRDENKEVINQHNQNGPVIDLKQELLTVDFLGQSCERQDGEREIHGASVFNTHVIDLLALRQRVQQKDKVSIVDVPRMEW